MLGAGSPGKISGPIRNLIGLVKTRLQKYCDEAKKLLSFPAQEETVDGDELLAEELTERMNININYL